MQGFVTTLKDFLAIKTSDIVNQLSLAYPNADESQISSWRVLIDDLRVSPCINKFNLNTVISFEYSLPNENMVVDLLIALNDKKTDTRYVFIVESKRWSDEYIERIEFAKNRTFGKELHPQVQCKNYYYSFRDYLDIGKSYKILPLVFIRNCSQRGLDIVIQNNPDGYSSIPCFNNMNDLLTYISEIVLLQDDTNLLKDFLNANYQPSKCVINAMESIVSKEPPFILTKKQEESISQIKEALLTGKNIIRIRGAAGSGKTALLLHMFVGYLRNMNRIKTIPIFISGAQNTNLYRSLYPDVKNLFEYSYCLANKISKGNGSNYIVFMDEAQHNKEGIIRDLVNKKVKLILCYDENQTINASNSLEELRELEQRNDFVSIDLKETIRYNGSELAETNISNILNGFMNVKSDEKFDLKVFSDFIDFQNNVIELIRDKSDSTIAVTGLLCNDSMSFTMDGNKDSIFYTNWGFKGECDWVPYVMGKNYLSKNNGKIWVGTWWLPGLDVDYVCVIVGGDAKITKNGLVGVPELAKHYQMILSVAEELKFLHLVLVEKTKQGKKEIDNKKTADSIINYINKPENKTLKNIFINKFSMYLKNNYYISLTRGRKGCYIYFANNELNN